MFLLIVVGLLAGIVTSLSPCVLPVLPIVLAAGVPRSAASIAAEPGASGVVVAVDPRDGPTRSRSWRPYGVVAGLVISFSASTLFGSLVLGALHLPQDLLRDAGVVVLVVIGLSLLWPRFADLLERPFARIPGRAVDPDSNGIVLGLGLGLLFVPCAGPVLATIAVVGASHRVSFGALGRRSRICHRRTRRPARTERPSTQHLPGTGRPGHCLGQGRRETLHNRGRGRSAEALHAPEPAGRPARDPRPHRESGCAGLRLHLRLRRGGRTGREDCCAVICRSSIRPPGCCPGSRRCPTGDIHRPGPAPRAGSGGCRGSSVACARRIGADRGRQPDLRAGRRLLLGSIRSLRARQGGDRGRVGVRRGSRRHRELRRGQHR